MAAGTYTGGRGIDYGQARSYTGGRSSARAQRKTRKVPKSAGHLQIHLLLPFIPVTRRQKT